MKQCFKCHRELPRTEFYRHPMMADGLLGKCKECTQCDVRINRQARVGYYRAYDRVRNASPERLERRQRYLRTPEGQATDKIGKIRWEIANPDKKAAHTAVSNAVRDGRLIPQPCMVCGKKAHGHHEDYSQPLEVAWLCPRHHRDRHRGLLDLSWVLA